MASIQGLQKALDSKTFDPSDFTQDQLILVDELIKTGNLQGYGSINDVIKERAGAAVGVAQEKQKKIQPFQQATKEAGFEIERADLELIGDVSGSAFAIMQDKDKLVNALKKGMGAVEFGVDREALNYRSMQFDKYENLLKNAPIVRNIKPFARVAGVVGKMADGFRQIKKAGASPFLQTEMKSIAFGTGGAGIGSLAFDAANYATDFTAASSMDLAELTDDDVAKLPPGQREAYHALEAMNNSMIFNAGAAGLGPLLQLASGGVKKVLGLSTPEVEQLARYTKETGVPTNLFALADPNAGFLARGMKNILNVVGVFPATAGPGMKYKQEIEEETFKAVLDHLNAGAPYSHAELLSLGTLNQFKKNFADYKDVIAMKYDTVFKEADLLGPDLKIIPIQNLGKATENVINSLKAQYPSDMGLQLDKRISELTEFDDPIVKFIAATKEYTNGLTEGLTAKEYIGLNKMLTAAYGDTKIYDPRGLVAQINHALKADFNTVAEAPSIKVLMNDNKQVKEAYDNVVKSQGESGGQLYVQNLINGVKGVQKELLDANDFFTKTTSTFKSPVASKIKQVDANLFSNLGLLGVQGKYTVNPDELWSKTLKQIFRNGSKDSIEQMKFLLGYDKGGPGKEIFDRFKQLYMFDAFQYAFKKKPDLTGEPLFDLMDKARDRGVIMKKYVDELNPSLTADIRIQRGVDPKALLASKLGDQKFVDFKFQADKVAGFDPNMFEANLGLVGDSATVTTGKNRLIAMYGGGAEGKKGFDQLSKIIQLMKANASYTIGDPSTFVKRRAVLGGMGAIAGGILPFAAATTVGIVPTLAFVFLSRYAGAVLSNPKSVEALFDVLNPTLKIEKAIAGKLDLSKKRVFAALLNNAMDEDKDAPKVDPNLINAEEITNYLLRKSPQMPNARFNISALPKTQMERMYPELTAISKTPGPELAGYQNFVRGAAIARQKDEAASFIESQIPDPTGPRQAMNMQQKQGQQGQQPMIPQMRQPMQTQVAQNPALFRALNPQDTLGQAIVERQSGTV